MTAARSHAWEMRFGYVNVFTSHVNVGFFHGASLPESAGLLQGTSKFVRPVKLRPGMATNAVALRRLIEDGCRDTCVMHIQTNTPDVTHEGAPLASSSVSRSLQTTPNRAPFYIAWPTLFPFCFFVRISTMWPPTVP
jgi:hypothetical protein